MNRLTQTLFAVAALISNAVAAELKYSVVPNFFDAKPDGQAIGACHGGLVIDKAGNLYVTTDTKRGVLVFSAAGKFVRNFGPSHIHGLEIREEGGVEFIYAARPSQHEVVKMALNGEPVWTITTPADAGLYKDGKG